MKRLFSCQRSCLESPSCISLWQRNLTKFELGWDLAAFVVGNWWLDNVLMTFHGGGRRSGELIVIMEEQFPYFRTSLNRVCQKEWGPYQRWSCHSHESYVRFSVMRRTLNTDSIGISYPRFCSLCQILSLDPSFLALETPPDLRTTL